MPAKSKAQQRFMGMVHAYKKGELKGSEVSKAIKDAAKSMKKKSSKDYASTKHDDLPNKVKSESTKSWNQSLAKIAKDRQLKSLSKKDRETLMKISKMMKKANESVIYENPAASAAAAMVMMKLQNPSTGKKISAVTPLRDKDHPLHKKSKGIFQRLKDKFMKRNESVNEQSKTIKSIQNLADKNKYGTVSGTRMNGKTAREIIAIYNHPKMKSFRGKMDKMKSQELMDLTIRLPRMLGIKVESVNENVQKVAKLLIKRGEKPSDVKDMVKKHYKKAKKDRSKAGPSDLAKYISFLSANESVNEISGVDVAKKIVKNKQHEKGIDLQTANLIVTIDKAYNKNPRIQKKFRAIQLPKMKQLIMKYYG